MALDIAALVAPLSDEAPSGPDLSYYDERVEIESAFERSVSVDSSGDDDTTDWRAVIDQITSQAKRTRDMWLPIYLMRAAAASKRFELVVDGAELLAGLVEERWGDVHPQLDEYGFIGRKTPCESLTRTGEFLGPLVRVPLIEHPRLGRFTGEDLIRFRDKGVSAEGYGMFRKVVEDMPPEDLQAILARFDSLVTALRRLDGVMTANAEGDTATNFRPTYDLLDSIRTALVAHVPGAEPDPAATDDLGDGWPADAGGADTGFGGGVALASGPGFSGTIRSRDEAIRALDAICAYFAAFEPGSPVPLALTRAREWIGLDFMSVLQDIAPNSLGEAGVILRSRLGAGGDTPAAASADWNAAPAPAVEDSGW
jgi:type VI secretion system protein ImpA